MAEIEVKQTVNKLFAPLWDEKARYYILMGGRGRGASTAASQYLLSNLIAPEFFRSAIMREVHSDIRHSVWRELNDRIEEQGIRETLHIADNDMRVSYGKNTIQAHGFKASSASHTAKLKSLANYNVVDIDEADEVGEPEFMVLDDSLRTKKGKIKIILVLNAPPKNHWIIQRFFDLEESGVQGFFIPRLKPDTNAVHIAGTHLDNLKNLDEMTVKRYQGYKTTKPDYYYQVIEGLVPETVRGKIYSGWQQIESIPEGARLVRFGLDWGWFPDPVSVVALYYYNGSYIADEVIHGTNIEDEMVAGAIKQVPGYEFVPVICGADEPKSIELMKKYKIRAETGVKGPGSVEYRIKATASKKMFVTKRSKNIWAGYENYAWAEDKDGNPKGIPNHYLSDTMDALGMAVASVNPNEQFIRPRQEPRKPRQNIAV